MPDAKKRRQATTHQHIAHAVAATRFLSQAAPGQQADAAAQPASADHRHKAAVKTSGGQICGAGTSLTRILRLKEEIGLLP